MSRSDKLSFRDSRLTRDFRHAIPFFVIKTREMLKRFTFKANKYPKLYQEKNEKDGNKIARQANGSSEEPKVFVFFLGQQNRETETEMTCKYIYIYLS